MSFCLLLASKRNRTLYVGSTEDSFERERFNPTWRDLFLDFTASKRLGPRLARG